MELTNEIKAQVLREEADYYYNRGERVFAREVAASLRARADKLDSPRPEPETVVWCIWFLDDEPVNHLFLREDDALGYINSKPQLRGGIVVPLLLPAHISGPRQVVVDVPPVSEWPDWAEAMEWRFISPLVLQDRPFLTRAEAERMEANG